MPPDAPVYSRRQQVGRIVTGASWNDKVEELIGDVHPLAGWAVVVPPSSTSQSRVLSYAPVVVERVNKLTTSAKINVSSEIALFTGQISSMSDKARETTQSAQERLIKNAKKAGQVAIEPLLEHYEVYKAKRDTVEQKIDRAKKHGKSFVKDTRDGLLLIKADVLMLKALNAKMRADKEKSHQQSRIEKSDKRETALRALEAEYRNRAQQISDKA